MEFEDVREEVEWDARRIAAAFGVESWEHVETETPFVGYQERSYVSENIWEWLKCELNPVDGTLYSIEISDYGNVCHLFDASCLTDDNYMDPHRRKYWVLYEHPRYNGRMARGLYCLGFEEEEILSQLPELSAHEKLELRLSMPREFWPQRWLDEEEKGEVTMKPKHQ